MWIKYVQEIGRKTINLGQKTGALAIFLFQALLGIFTFSFSSKRDPNQFTGGVSHQYLISP